MAAIIAEHALKHGLTESEILYAWNNYVRMQQRPAPNEEYVAAIWSRWWLSSWRTGTSSSMP